MAPVCSVRKTWQRPAGLISALASIVIPVFLVGVPAAVSREKDAMQHGAGIIINVPFPEDQVAQVVQDVVQNGIIRGTKEYNKDPYVSGATSVSSTRLFRKWEAGGEVFYKQRLHAVDPRNFKDSSDVGTLIVRYILQPQGSKNTVLRINALFVEDFRHTVHQSNGSVEEAEYADIHERLDKLSAMNAETAELERQKKADATGFSSSQSVITATTPTPSATNPTQPAATTPPSTATPVQEVSMAEAKAAAIAVPQSLDERVKQLRHDVERVVKAPGAALKSAPFHSAVTLQPLPTGAEVLVVITTTYWLGVETHDGQHGWVMRDDLEQLP